MIIKNFQEVGGKKKKLVQIIKYLECILVALARETLTKDLGQKLPGRENNKSKIVLR